MKKLGVNAIRELYLSFFESKGHIRMPSASLVPQGDKSLLLINSGMAPLKKFFLGQAQPPGPRVTTCQKCIRTPDIERVGKTSRHGTYFEMLGNFSFGDYFKTEAIDWAWELFTKVLEIPSEKLYISVYEEDDEAYDIWTQRVGIAPSHMVRLGKADNFWEHGSGPCGPCSEIYFDRGEENGCGSPDCQVGCDCDRFVEVWNLVFTQFDSDGNGSYAPMEKKNIDTGMGLERLACVLQGVGNLFEIDTVANIMKHICEIADVKYKENEKTDVSLRVITDHIRSTAFMVGDGVLPSNEGRGYVLRRLLRRAARHGRLLGITEPFLYKVCETVIRENASAYPELEEKHDYIVKIIRIEEENFARTIGNGMELLNSFIDAVEKAKTEKILSGDDAFRLSDTYGFPLDLTIEIASEKGISVDTERFRILMQEQREKARSDRASKTGSSWEDDSGMELKLPPTEFTGYTQLTDMRTKVLAIISDGALQNEIHEGDRAGIILSSTPFYAESGGQVGDKGSIFGEGVFEVDTTKKLPGGQHLHLGQVKSGSIICGQEYAAGVDKTSRRATMRNHTAAHLLQSALIKVLGSHVHQAGQLVDAERCRFDFSHFSALTPEEISNIEDIVNTRILEADPVLSEEMPLEEARKVGAMALFGEKYGDIVRVVSVKGFSAEFCGGTHVGNTAELGLFRIVSEYSVASGVRRIEAVTGDNVLKLIDDYKANLLKSSAVFKLSNAGELPARCAAAVSEIKSLEKKVAELNAEIAESQMLDVFRNAREVGGIKLISGLFNGTQPDILRQMGDKVREQHPSAIAVFAGTYDETGTYCCVCGADAIKKGAHAGKIVQRVAAVSGGKGGGRPESAMAGIGKTYMIDEALEAFAGIAADFIK